MADDRLTIVVPVLNEAKRLQPLLAQINRMRCRVIVVDGGSSDGTREMLHTTGHVEVVDSPCGRARQMNAGAARAGSPFLLFLHADTVLPDAGVLLVVEALGAGGACWGRFDVCFDNPTPLLNSVAWFMNQRSALTGICTGDQALFVSAEALATVGGFRDIPLMEDIDLCKRLKRLGKPIRLRAPVVTAARRWQVNGVVRTIVTMWWLRFCYWLGTPPTTLSKWYDHIR